MEEFAYWKWEEATAQYFKWVADYGEDPLDFFFNAKDLKAQALKAAKEHALLAKKEKRAHKKHPHYMV